MNYLHTLDGGDIALWVLAWWLLHNDCAGARLLWAFLTRRRIRRTPLHAAIADAGRRARNRRTA